MSGYQEPEVDKYVMKEEYYVSLNSSIARLFKPKKKSILALFSDKKESVIDFVKKNKLKYGKESDLIKIFKFYSSL